jgi:hypothetical protein
MSQMVVYELLRELGGRATSIDVAQLAAEKYPEATLHLYVKNRLRKLEGRGWIRHNQDGTWQIVPQKRGIEVPEWLVHA